jgi:hypothetical protein
VERHGAETTLPPVNDRPELTTTRVRTDDWPVQATDSIVKVVGTAHDKVTGPITTAARALVFGLFAGILGTVALVLVMVLAVRLLDNYLPSEYVGDQHVWLAYLILGILTAGFALWLWSKAKSRPEEA